MKKIGLIAALWMAASSSATGQERALNEVQIGFERAFRIPLEIQLLRAAVRKEAWRGLERQGRIDLTESERVSLAASFSRKDRCDLRPG